MSPIEARNISVVLKYFDGCNSGDINDLLSTLDPDVIHYFLPEQFKPIRGAEHLAKYWRKFKVLLNPTWKIDHIIAQDNEVVSEWSCLWTPQGTSRRVIMRGTEWYVMHEGRITATLERGAFDEETIMRHATGIDMQQTTTAA